MDESKKVRVLLADDEKHVRQLIKAILGPLDCEVVGEAESGTEAVALYQETRPDVVFLDISMPVKDGIAALREIMAVEPDAVVIMLTSISDSGTVQAALELGAAHFIRKDTPPLEMRDIIKEAWREYLPRQS